MTRHLVLLSFTEQGVAGVKDSIERAGGFKDKAAKAGASVETQYWTLGPYDGAFLLSAPDEATAAALVLDLGQHANVKTTMLRAFDADEFKSVLAKMA